jgi:hypothetical protein
LAITRRLSISREEENSVTFFAEHSPCLEVHDGVFDGGPDLPQGGVELGFQWCEVATGESFERYDLDALDTDVTQVAAATVAPVVTAAEPAEAEVEPVMAGGAVG